MREKSDYEDAEQCEQRWLIIEMFMNNRLEMRCMYFGKKRDILGKVCKFNGKSFIVFFPAFLFFSFRQQGRA